MGRGQPAAGGELHHRAAVVDAPPEPRESPWAWLRHSGEPGVLSRAFWFGRVDGRAVSVFRIVFAVLLVKDALFHLPIATFFYSDDGVVPRSVLLELARSARFSLMDAMPHPWMAMLFFLLWAAVAVCLLLGYRTRLMVVLNFIILLSVHERNTYVLTGADSMMRALSFWMMFVPLNAYYSLDARIARRAGRPFDRTGYAFPVRMMQLQVALVYVFAGWLKALGPMWTNGEAMHYVLQINTLLWPFGVWFRDVAPDALLVFMTHITIVGELLFIVLVFAPFGQPFLRMLGLLFGVALHVGIGVMLSIPDFSIVMMTSYLIFLPSPWLAALERRLFRAAVSSDVAVEGAIPEPVRASRLGRVAVTVGLSVAMLGVIWWNLDYVNDHTPVAPPMPQAVETVMWYSGLWQYWDLFAPTPIQVDGWVTIPGRFEDGTVLDLRTGAAPNDALQNVMLGPWVRWEKFEENVFNWQYAPILRAWGGSYCRQYNVVEGRPEGERLAILAIEYRYKRSVAPGQPPNEYTNAVMWTHWCYDEYAGLGVRDGG